MNDFGRLSQAIGLPVYERSVSQAGTANYFLARRGNDKLVGCWGQPCLPETSKAGELDGKCVCLGPLSHANAQAIRAALSWTAPRKLGLATSIGMGDRLGLATPGHIRAIRGTGMLGVLAQQSMREMGRTQRTPENVIDAATWGVLQEGHKDGFGADGDHLQKLEDLDVTVPAGFTMFTIDPGAHVNGNADAMTPAELSRAYETLDFSSLAITSGELRMMYVSRNFKLADGSKLDFDEVSLMRAAVKYGHAIAHVARMYNRLVAMRGEAFELEVSVDETQTPTSPAEHYFFASELRRLNVKWVSMAPRFVGRFEKGVDYIGDLSAFRESFARHVVVMRTLGPYKMSIHSGSDKFSIYPIIAELAGDLVHLKTAGTSWLEALRAVAAIDPQLFRGMLGFACERYETDKLSYHVSADVAKVPPAAGMDDAALVGLLEDFHAREVLHVTFGSILTADDGQRFKTGLYKALQSSEEVYYDMLQRHLGKHAAPFARK